MKKITPELAEICGIHAGDGYLRIRERNKGEVDISGNIEEQEYYDSHVVPLFNKVFGMKIEGKLFSRGTYGLVCYKKSVRETLIALGFPSGPKSETVKVPNKIINSRNKILYTKFLRGFLDTDGNISFTRKTGKYSKFKLENNCYPVVSITTISPKMANQIKFMLDFLKIKSFTYHHHSKKQLEKDSYRVIVSGKERLEKWMKLIGSKNPGKITRYLVWKKHGFCPPNTTLQQRKEILNGSKRN